MSVATHPAPARRTPLAVRRSLLVVASLLALFLVATGAYNVLDLAARHTTTERATYTDVRELVIDDAGSVRLTGAPASAPLVVRTRVREGLRSPDLDATRGAGAALRLESSCPSFFGGSCRVEYDVSVPAGTVVRARSSAGDVVAEELTASQALTLSSSAGDVTAIDVTAPAIELTTSAGDVQARGLSAKEVSLDSSAGDVVAAFSAPADRLLAHSSAGDVELLVPNAVYRVDASSSAGDVDTGSVRTDPAAAHAITAHSSAGDVGIAARR
jgi:hypothetical protein